MEKVEVKGIEVYYHNCCWTEKEATRHALKDNAKNYAEGRVDRIKCIAFDHKNYCKKRND